MKKQYQDILLDCANLIGKIPGVNMSGATATASVYVSAYRDYYKACQLFSIIASSIESIDSLEFTINKYKNKDGYDIEELKEQVEWYSERVDEAYKKLKEYIAEREDKQWR